MQENSSGPKNGSNPSTWPRGAKSDQTQSVKKKKKSDFFKLGDFNIFVGNRADQEPWMMPRIMSEFIVNKCLLLSNIIPLYFRL